MSTTTPKKSKATVELKKLSLRRTNVIAPAVMDSAIKSAPAKRRDVATAFGLLSIKFA
jgi:hypothetical protein